MLSLLVLKGISLDRRECSGHGGHVSEECTWHGLAYISVKVNESSVNVDTVYMCVHVGEGCTWSAFE